MSPASALKTGQRWRTRTPPSHRGGGTGYAAPSSPTSWPWSPRSWLGAGRALVAARTGAAALAAPTNAAAVQPHYALAMGAARAGAALLVDDDQTTEGATEQLARYRGCELRHARWDITGTSPSTFLGVLTKYGIAPLKGPAWLSKGCGAPPIECLGNGQLIHAKLILTILGTQILLMGAAVYYRTIGGPREDDPPRPAAPFKPLGSADDRDTSARVEQTKTRNDRLAMLALLRYAI